MSDAARFLYRDATIVSACADRDRQKFDDTTHASVVAATEEDKVRYVDQCFDVIERAEIDKQSS